MDRTLVFEEVSSRKRQETKHTEKKQSQENRNNHFFKKRNNAESTRNCLKKNGNRYKKLSKNWNCRTRVMTHPNQGSGICWVLDFSIATLKARGPEERRGPWNPEGKCFQPKIVPPAKLAKKNGAKIEYFHSLSDTQHFPPTQCIRKLLEVCPQNEKETEKNDTWDPRHRV